MRLIQQEEMQIKRDKSKLNNNIYLFYLKPDSYKEK